MAWDRIMNECAEDGFESGMLLVTHRMTIRMQQKDKDGRTGVFSSRERSDNSRNISVRLGKCMPARNNLELGCTGKLVGFLEAAGRSFCRGAVTELAVATAEVTGENIDKCDRALDA